MSSSAYFPQFAPAFARALESLRGQRVAVVGHQRPDGDCIGSQVALARVLRSLGAEVICANGDPIPRRIAYVVEDLRFVRPEELPATENWVAAYVDCADHDRAGRKLRERFPTPFLSVDHHLSNGGYATHNFVDTAASATGELLAGLFLDAGLPVDTVTARALYLGVMTDTGQFRFGATSARTFRLAAELVERGAQPAEAGLHLFERESAGRMQLLQRFLASLRLECGGRVCLGVLSRGVFEETGATLEDTEGLVDYARSLEGVDIGGLIEERADGVKGSLRAKDPAMRVDQIAARFNGGGHACAAGLNSKLPFAEFYPALVAALAERLATVGGAPAAVITPSLPLVPGAAGAAGAPLR